MGNQSLFWDKTALKYSKKPVPSQEVYEKKLQQTRELFTPDSKVLEVGCGTGTTALLHAPYVKSITATDFSNEMIQIAKQKAEAKNCSNIDFRTESIEELNFPDEEFDVIMAHSILHLVSDRRKALKKIHQILKPQGQFVVGVGCVGGIFRLFQPIWYIGYLIGKLPYIGFFTKNSFIREIEKCGFVVKQKWDPSRVDLFIIAEKN